MKIKDIIKDSIKNFINGINDSTNSKNESSLDESNVASVFADTEKSISNYLDTIINKAKYPSSQKRIPISNKGKSKKTSPSLDISREGRA